MKFAAKRLLNLSSIFLKACRKAVLQRFVASPLKPCPNLPTKIHSESFLSLVKFNTTLKRLCHSVKKNPDPEMFSQPVQQEHICLAYKRKYKSLSGILLYTAFVEVLTGPIIERSY